jgi:predicted acetyltransferase
MIKTDKTQIKELWKECFDDSDEFIDLYFRLRYNNEVSVYFKSANQVITALQMLPYPFTYQGKVCSSSYISGACTHPEYRNIGAMRGLISEAFARMAKKNVAISTLIPADDWLFDYYGSMGYTTIFYCHESEVDTSSLPPSTGDTLTTDEFRKDFYEYYRRNMLKRDCCVQHTERDVRIILADMKIDHGFVVVALRERTVVGVAFVYLNEGAFYVADMIAETDRVKLQLLQAVHERDESLKIFLLSAPEPDEREHPSGHGPHHRCTSDAAALRREVPRRRDALLSQRRHPLLEQRLLPPLQGQVQQVGQASAEPPRQTHQDEYERAGDVPLQG